MIKTKTLLLALTLSLAASAGCSHKDDEPAPAAVAKPVAADETPKAPTPTPAPASALSCTNPSASQCTDFPGGDEALVKQQCDLIGGKLAVAACATAKKLGTCELAGMHKVITYYPGGDDNLNAKLAEDDCKTSSGTWHP